MEQKFNDTRQSGLALKNNNRKRTRSVLFCTIIFILGFLLGTFCKAEAAVLTRDSKGIANIEDKLQKIGPLDSTGASDSNSNTIKTGGVSNNAHAKPSSDEANGWQLILVNPWNKVPNDYKVTLKQLDNGQAIDERCYPDLQKMMDDCRAAGLTPLICSSYRSQEKQERLFNNEVKYYTNLAYSPDNAKTEAAKAVAIPGTSEHQLGLALDIVDTHNQNLDSSQEKTAVQKWLIEHSWEYGFILRYPTDKSDITGIIYEPWHYRYVGKEAAAEIHEQGICLEEYLK